MRIPANWGQTGLEELQIVSGLMLPRYCPQTRMASRELRRSGAPTGPFNICFRESLLKQ